MKFQETFTFQGKSLYYNRIEINNWGERAIEIPLAFDFLANLKKKDKILEIGNVLSRYENSLSEHLGVRPRHIVDKFESDMGVDNLDLMELPSDQKYDAIISISTVEHIGQGIDPTGDYGEQFTTRDLEAPLKAIAKIYDLLKLAGKALITVPFGKLINGGWYIQFSREYLELLHTKYLIPEGAISTFFMRKVFREPGGNNPRQIWVEEINSEQITDIEYNFPWPWSNAVAILEFTKIKEEFTLNVDVPPAPLTYQQSAFPIQAVHRDLFEPDFLQLIGKLKEINLICFLDWHQSEELIASDLERAIMSILSHPDKKNMTLFICINDISEEDANLLLSGVIMNLFIQSDLEPADFLEIYFVDRLSDIQWAALLPCLNFRILLNRENIPEIAELKAKEIPYLSVMDKS